MDMLIKDPQLTDFLLHNAATVTDFENGQQTYNNKIIYLKF